MTEPNVQAEAEHRLKERPLPKHVGVIMDGNGRWAESKGQNRLIGHREGSNSVREVTRCARRVGLQALTLYAFSSQNWLRPAEEVAGLMELLRDYLLKEREEILGNQIKLNAIGELDRLPAYVRDPLEELRAASAKNEGLILTLALSYGSREELIRAMAALMRKAKDGLIDPARLKEADVERELWTDGLPALDLVIRTSGEIRISNFLLWQAAYAELMFSEKLWPDFRSEAFVECLFEYQQRERRFGKTSAQLQAPAAKRAGA